MGWLDYREKRRDKWLREQDYKILRLKNEDVIYNLNFVLNQISNLLTKVETPSYLPLQGGGIENATI